jgi:hypothetical protein
VIASLSHVAQMIDERLQFWPSRDEEGFAVELSGEGLSFG